MFKRPFHILSAALLFCCTLPLYGAAAGAQERQEVRIGVLAKRGAQKTLQKWNPTADYLNKTLPKLSFRIVPMEFDEIPLLVKSGLVDFVIVNPAIYVDLNVRYGARAILTLNNRLSRERNLTEFGSVIFTRKDHQALNSLTDTRDRQVAAVHATSLGGWMMAYREILRAGINRKHFASLTFAETHDRVVEQVLARRVDAGIVRTDTLERMAQEGKIDLQQIKILNAHELPSFPLLLSTELYPEWPFSKVAHTEAELARRVALALMQLQPKNPAAEAASIHGWTVAENYQPIHELLQELEFPPYEDFRRVRFWDAIASYWHWVALGLAALLILLMMYLRILRLHRTLKRQQSALSAEEERFRSTFEQSAAGILQVSTEGQFLRFNQQFCTLLGYSELQLRRLNLNEITHPDDLPPLLAEFTRLQHDEIPALNRELRLLRADTKEQWVSLTFSGVRDLQGGIKYLTGVLLDIQQRKLLEQELRDERGRTELILDNAGDGILGLDRNGRHTFVNPAASEMLGYAVEDMLGRDSHSLWHHSHRDGSPFPAAECPISGVLHEGKVHRGWDAVFWRSDDSPLAVEYVSTPIVEEAGISGAVVIFRPFQGPELTEPE